MAMTFLEFLRKKCGADAYAFPSWVTDKHKTSRAAWDNCDFPQFMTKALFRSLNFSSETNMQRMKACAKDFVAVARVTGKRTFHRSWDDGGDFEHGWTERESVELIREIDAVTQAGLEDVVRRTIYAVSGSYWNDPYGSHRQADVGLAKLACVVRRHFALEEIDGGEAEICTACNSERKHPCPDCGHPVICRKCNGTGVMRV